MIFESGDSDQEKVYKTREHYLGVLSKLSPMRANMEKAYAFRHGNQWSSDAKQTLESEGRPALTFNLIAPIMRELTGANEDQRREARAAPVGAEDLPTSEAINHLWKRVYEQARVELVESEAFEDMIISGVGFVFIDAHPSERSPNELEFSFDPVSPFEVLWDPECSRTNMKDSGYFYWSRWMDESQFKEHYPEHAAQWEELTHQLENAADNIDTVRAELQTQYAGKLSADGLTDSKFFDRKLRRVRVLHLEYKVAVRRYFVWDPRPDSSGKERGYVKVEKVTYDKVKASGAFPVHSSMGTEWRWFECTGAQKLFEGEQPLPIYCSQLLPVTCYYDPVGQEFYGMVRDLADPQLEFNKRKSQELNLLNQQAQPGTIADEDAFTEESKAVVQRKLKEPGFYLERRAGKVVEFREPPTLPVGAHQLAESAQTLVQVIAGVDLNPMLGGQPDQVAVGTAMLSHRKGLLSISPILKNFRELQQKLLSSVVETILRGFGDEQIESMLGNSEKLAVQDGAIVNKETGASVPIRELRAVRWNIEMESAAANTTQQMIMFSLLQALRAGGVAIDPEVFFSYFPGSREERQKLTSYFKQAEQMAAQAQQAQMQASQEQIGNVVKVEAMKVAQRHEQAQLEDAREREMGQADLFVEFIKVMADAASKEGANSAAMLRNIVEAAKAQVAGFKASSDTQMRRQENAIYEREAAMRAQQSAAPTA